MKRLVVFLSLLFAVVAVEAQVVTSFSMDMFKNVSMASFKAQVKDASDGQAIPFASVYLVPVKDTVITHFSLTDADGKVEIDKIPYGRYNLNVEIVGYKKYTKETNFRSEYETDLGTINMEIDKEQLNAATVSAIGNAVTILKDTVVYNASAFHVRDNAMLGELLKKMPGIEVGNDGSVTVNGEKVDKITVGGKTFFFDDTQTAVNNIPAQIVDKVKVIDKNTDESQFTGIASGADKEKIMDLELKDEYKSGWFGNVSFGGGTTLAKGGEDYLLDDRGLLYSGNALVNAYTEKDMITVLGNASNVTEGVGLVSVRYGGEVDEEADLDMNGLNTSSQAGVNFDTDRIKGMETAITLNYKRNTNDASERSARTSFVKDGSGDITTDSQYDGLKTSDGLSLMARFNNKNKKKYTLNFTPVFRYDNSQTESTKFAETKQNGLGLNETMSMNSRNSKGLAVTGNLNLGIKFKNPKRSLSIYTSYDLSSSKGDGMEFSVVKHANGSEKKDIYYDRDGGVRSLYGRVQYVEPLFNHWMGRVELSSNVKNRHSTKDATNGDGTVNEFYSSYSDNNYRNSHANLLLQYDKDKDNLQFGVSISAVNNETETKSMGKTTVTGKDETQWIFSPSFNYRRRITGGLLSSVISTDILRPSERYIQPVIDLGDMTNLTVGNIYLKPHANNRGYIIFQKNDPKTFALCNASFMGNLDSSPIVYATWFNDSGVRFAVPVNSQSPSVSGSLSGYYNRPVNKERTLSLGIRANLFYDRNVSYQAKSTMPGFDLQNFDYAAFMDSFWGDVNGGRFYSGQSGFAASNMSDVTAGLNLRAKYSPVASFSANAALDLSNRRSFYSLDPDANMNTWSNYASLELSYDTKNEFEFVTEVEYNWYRGYANGFGRPEFIWDASVSKSIKSVTLSLMANDILNQSSGINRVVNQNYVEDSYRNVMGRWFLLKASFSFGKSGAKQGMRAQSAAFNFMY